MKQNQSGFTLIELLVVVAVIGILAAIAIPQFSEYRKRSYDARSVTDLRNAATAEEAYFSDNEAYKTCASASACGTALPGYKASNGVVLSMTADLTSFTGSAYHDRGIRNSSSNAYFWNSVNGGLCPTDSAC